MKSEVKTLWLDALRSGRYRKGEGKLKQPGTKNTKARFCCLGVLCDLYKKYTGKGTWLPDGSFQTGPKSQERNVLPPAVRTWAGLSKSDPVVMVKVEDSFDEEGQECGNEPCALAEINDGDVRLLGIGDKIAGFKEIAALIETKIRG